MSASQPLDAAGARIVNRLHTSIVNLIDGNAVQRSEVINAGGRSCPCHLIYKVEWTFVPYTSERRLQGNVAVSTHFGYNHAKYIEETSHRCEIGRSHKPVREGFITQVLAGGGSALADAEKSTQVWDFGQHSVHELCAPCCGGGEVTCRFCWGGGRETCYGCGGGGSTTQTRWVSGHNGHGRNETYRLTCFSCSGSGRVTCRHCSGSGRIRCSECGGHGFFTDLMSVTLRAEPHVRFTIRSELSRDALSGYLVNLPVAQVVHYFDFTQFNHEDAAADKWHVDYEVHTTLAELDVSLHSKLYMAAAVGDKALAFIRPPIFDDVFIEEIADLKKIWSGKKKSVNNERAHKFFVTYKGQPVLDAAMRSVAKLKSQDRELPGREVSTACDGYISSASADLLGKLMLALLDKVSPPNSLWSWISVMTLPFLLLFLGAQNWVESNMPKGDYFSIVIVWVVLTVFAALLTTSVSPVAAFISTIVSAIRRRSLPAEYRQHGRNWQPLKSFVRASAAVATLGVAIGILTHYQKLPRWDNWPMNMIEETLSLNRFVPYAQTSALLKTAGFFVSPRAAYTIMPATDPIVVDIQVSLKRLGYIVAVTGRMDDATRQAVVAYAKKRKLKTTEPQTVLTSLCKDIPGTCTKVTQRHF